MPRLHYHLVDVFTDVLFGGNPLAVFTEADGLAAATMQRIAHELNLSETTFVSTSTRVGCDARLRIFTPRAELPMAGHPTLGSAFVVARGGEIVFEEGVGPVRVRRGALPSGRTGWWMKQLAPAFSPCPDARADVALALGLDVDDLGASPIEIGSSGTPGLFVPVASLDALRRASLGAEAWRRLRASHESLLAYVFCNVSGAARVRARMFGPALGVAEDPATGGAGGPLGFYLLRHGLVTATAGGRTSIHCEQGVEMARPSTLEIAVVEDARETYAEVGGGCVAVGEGWLDVSPE
jgi:trans-2,3-dihydro-3-hydroxyanthranilate isomerase